MTEVRIPGDKSISHRFLILGALARGNSLLENVPRSLDVRSTAACLRALGARLEPGEDGALRVEGPTNWRSPESPLDCGNSGTTARLLAGLVTGLGLEAELTGDASLCRRPMDRVVYPLQAMGGRLRYSRSPDRLPLRIEGRASGGLRPLKYRPRVSSAQVRGALLLAGITARVDLEIIDRQQPRDHTERILQSMGAPIVAEAGDEGDRIRLSPGDWDGGLSPLRARVPGDPSAAAFLAVAALLADRAITFRSMGMNPRRTGWITVLERMGAGVERRLTGHEAGEPVGNLTVRPASLAPFNISPPEVPGLIDELPALAVLASRVSGASEIRGAGELRVKESDRLALLAENLGALGIGCEQTDENLRVMGGEPKPGVVRTCGDHRIAMAFGALGASSGSEIRVDDRECVAVSFPGFWDALAEVIPGRGGS